jgi:hypothetical protein
MTDAEGVGAGTNKKFGLVSGQDKTREKLRAGPSPSGATPHRHRETECLISIKVLLRQGVSASVRIWDLSLPTRHQLAVVRP